MRHSISVHIYEGEHSRFMYWTLLVLVSQTDECSLLTDFIFLFSMRPCLRMRFPSTKLCHLLSCCCSSSRLRISSSVRPWTYDFLRDGGLLWVATGACPWSSPSSLDNCTLSNPGSKWSGTEWSSLDGSVSQFRYIGGGVVLLKESQTMPWKNGWLLRLGYASESEAPRRSAESNTNSFWIRSFAVSSNPSGKSYSRFWILRKMMYSLRDWKGGEPASIW